jgi:hypothetical protein
MTVLARFYVSSITKFPSHESGYAAPAPRGQIKLQAVSRGEENKVWASATPHGELTMTVNNGDAFTWFEDHLGKEVMITFETAPEPETE